MAPGAPLSLPGKPTLAKNSTVNPVDDFEDIETETTLVAKVGMIAVTFAAGWATRKLLAVAWKKVTGNEAPTKPDDPELGLVPATVFAALAAGTAVLAKRLAAQGAHRAAARIATNRSVVHRSR